jgi:adenylate cyclase class IV
MGYRNREIEKKFEIKNGWRYDATAKTVKCCLRKLIKKIIHGDSTDIYFNTPKSIKADFARVRMMPHGEAQMTVKHSDKGSTTNRVEIDVDVKDPAQAIAICTQFFGLPARSVRKRYSVFFLDKKDTNVSIYKVQGDHRIFLEIEARDIKKVERITKKLKKAIDLHHEKKSIYQLFVKGRK